MTPRFAALLLASLTSLGCSRSETQPEPLPARSTSLRSAPSQPIDQPPTASPTISIAPTISASAPVPPRVAAYCARQANWKHAMSPDCISCLQGILPKSSTCLRAVGAFGMCFQDAGDGMQSQVSSCTVRCGADCPCSVNCYASLPKTCFDNYLSQMECLTRACDSACR